MMVSSARRLATSPVLETSCQPTSWRRSAFMYSSRTRRIWRSTASMGRAFSRPAAMAAAAAMTRNLMANSSMTSAKSGLFSASRRSPQIREKMGKMTPEPAPPRQPMARRVRSRFVAYRKRRE
jgi:hypothetical protein